MKNTILTIALAAIGFGASAQVSPYVFPAFANGTVIQKGGGKATANLNYNTVTQEMLFMQGANKVVLDPATVDTIIIQDKKFIPAAKAYYLKLTNTKIPLYQQITNNKSGNTGVADAAAGIGRSMTGTEDYTKQTNTSAADYDLAYKDGVKLLADNKFWLEKDKEFRKANDTKDIIKVFPDKEQAIEAFVKQNNIDFKKAEDVAKLVVFCNSGTTSM